MALRIISLTFLAAAAALTTAAADPLLFTLSNVQFADGAAATGSFVFDPATSTYVAFDITTTAGVSGDSYSGSEYALANGTKTNYLSSPDAYIFDNFSADSHYLTLSLANGAHVTMPGTYSLAPGSSAGAGSFNDSGEYVDANLDYRLIANGALIVTAVPEPEPLALVGLAAIGFGAIARKRRAR